MKEIKFRIWDKICNRFFNIDYNYPVTITNQGKIGVLVDDFNFEEFKKDELKNIIISEYTGLKDKNGKEIYEGDIVKFDDTGEDEYYESYDFKNVAEITFNDGRYELKNFLEKNTTVSNGMIRDWDNEMWFEFMDKELTIIGNIYENPELLGDN